MELSDLIVFTLTSPIWLAFAMLLLCIFIIIVIVAIEAAFLIVAAVMIMVQTILMPVIVPVINAFRPNVKLQRIPPPNVVNIFICTNKELEKSLRRFEKSLKQMKSGLNSK